MLGRRFALLCAAALMCLALVAPGVASAREPILFVHGWSSNGATWLPMVERFKADGWNSSELNAWSYNSSQSNVTTAAQVRDKVDQIRAATGADKVDIVTHSMGGLSSRYYLKNLGGTAKVDDWISLGGPNHGTATAWACFTTSCGEMRGGSSFLNALNSGDETPGAVAYATWWSWCDIVINPDTSVKLDGARNIMTGCLSHGGLLTDRYTYEQVRDHVRTGF